MLPMGWPQSTVLCTFRLLCVGSRVLPLPTWRHMHPLLPVCDGRI